MINKVLCSIILLFAVNVLAMEKTAALSKEKPHVRRAVRKGMVRVRAQVSNISDIAYIMRAPKSSPNQDKSFIGAKKEGMKVPSKNNTEEVKFHLVFGQAKDTLLDRELQDLFIFKKDNCLTFTFTNYVRQKSENLYTYTGALSDRGAIHTNQ